MPPINDDFLDRVFARLPHGPVNDFVFSRWDAGKPTQEVLGMLPVPGVDAERFLTRVMDIDHYVGKIAHVEVSRSIEDPDYDPPRSVRFYQKIRLPIIGALHQELAIQRLGVRHGYEVAAWTLLEAQTQALDGKKAIRSASNDGAWLVGDGVVGYALSSVPLRKDVGFLKWQALTKGADLAASTAVKDNIKGMAAWAAEG